jgi:hypothetical protein
MISQFGMQVTENEENKVQTGTSLFAETLAEIQIEANRLKSLRPNERKPSAAKVVERAWKLYKSAADLSPKQQEDLAAFIGLLKAGSPPDLRNSASTHRDDNPSLRRLNPDVEDKIATVLESGNEDAKWNLTDAINTTFDMVKFAMTADEVHKREAAHRNERLGKSGGESKTKGGKVKGDVPSPTRKVS